MRIPDQTGLDRSSGAGVTEHTPRTKGPNPLISHSDPLVHSIALHSRARCRGQTGGKRPMQAASERVEQRRDPEPVQARRGGLCQTGLCVRGEGVRGGDGNRDSLRP